MFVFHCARRDCHHGGLHFIPSGIKIKRQKQTKQTTQQKKKTAPTSANIKTEKPTKAPLTEASFRLCFLQPQPGA